MKTKVYPSFLTITAGLGSMITGVLFTSFNASISTVLPALNSVATFDNAYVPLLSAIIPFGAIFGALLCNYSVDTLGRRYSIIIADGLALVGCLMSVLPLFMIMFIGRLMCGLACGINCVMVPLYIEELSTLYSDKRATAISRIMFTTGALFVFFLAFCFETWLSGFENAWLVLYLIPLALILSRLLVFTLVAKFDTPAYYMTTKQETRAFNALKKLWTLEEIDSAYQYESNVDRITGFYDLFKSKYIKQTKIAIILTFMAQLMGTNVLFFHSTIIFAARKDLSFRSLPSLAMENLWFGLTVFLVTLLGSKLVGKLRRRLLLVYGTLVLTGLSFLVSGSEALEFWVGQTTLVLVYAGFQALLFGLMLGVYHEELVPLIGMSGLVMLEMILTTLTVAATPFIAIKELFVVFGVVGAVSFIPIFKGIKETKNKSKEEVLRMFQTTKENGLLDDAVQTGVTIY